MCRRSRRSPEGTKWAKRDWENCWGESLATLLRCAVTDPLRMILKRSNKVNPSPDFISVFVQIVPTYLTVPWGPGDPSKAPK